MSKYYIESNGIWKGKHQLSWGELCDELKQLEKENEQLKSGIKELESELELYKHHVEFIPSSEW